MLVPGLNYTFETYIECLSDKGVSDTVKVKLLQSNSFMISIKLTTFEELLGLFITLVKLWFTLKSPPKLSETTWSWERCAPAKLSLIFTAS